MREDRAQGLLARWLPGDIPLALILLPRAVSTRYHLSTRLHDFDYYFSPTELPLPNLSNRLDRRYLSLRLADLSIGNTSSYFTPLFSIYIVCTDTQRRNVVYELGNVFCIPNNFLEAEKIRNEIAVSGSIVSIEFSLVLFDNLYFPSNTIR